MFYFDNYIEPSLFFNPEDNMVPLDQWDLPQAVLVQGNFWMSGEKFISAMIQAKDVGSNPLTIKDKCVQVMFSSVSIQIVGIKQDTKEDCTQLLKVKKANGVVKE